MSFSPAARTYVAAVIAAGTVALAWSAWDLVGAPPANHYWLVLLALTCFSSTFSIRIPNVSTTISVSETFVFLCALLYGGSAATIIIAIDGLLMSFLRGHRRPAQLAFNVTEPALSLFVAARVFGVLAEHDIGGAPSEHVVDRVVPLAGFTLTYFLLNSGLNAGIVAQLRRAPLWPIWRAHFGAVLLNYCGAASVAGLLVYNSHDFSFATLAIVLPLLVISYFTFKTSLERVEDANRHLEQMNRLYLSTIETLAMAVDATDQITHGHIRRVQSWAVGLAKTLGVTDESQLKAIEAAALLHDVGKLAIPEHILNKPGRLSPAEFEKMKKHASIGADILSAIDFPYPVVPIVRHHHEQWDGSGYPSGISGADIPIGARILSVVDCFDALTSDRPYRRALSDEQALSMLLDQRGKAYDPLVVDMFARVYRDIAPADQEPGPRGETLKEIAAVSHSAPAAQTAAAPDAVDIGHETVALSHALLQGPWRTSRQELRELARALRRVTPASLVVCYEHDEERSRLAVLEADGDGQEQLDGFAIGIGERLSGWVAANRRVICNSDASLDFVTHDPPMPVASCLSVPVVHGSALLGVVSLYAPTAAAFEERHRRWVERAVVPLGHLWKSIHEAAAAERLLAPHAVAGLEPFDAGRIPWAPGQTAAAVWLGAAAAVAPAARLGLLVRATHHLQSDGDGLVHVFRAGDEGLVAILPAQDLRSAVVRAAGARRRIADYRFTVGTAVVPRDGRDLATVVEVARRRAQLALCGAGAHRDDETPSTEQAGLFDERPGPTAGVA